MGLLLFKKVFAEPIREGLKTTTLRRWDRPRCRAGQRVFAPGVGYLQVLDVKQVKLKDLVRDDARADGFASLAALRRALREMYDARQRGRPLWRVRFRWLTSA